jgi:HEAT repeat protein
VPTEYVVAGKEADDVQMIWWSIQQLKARKPESRIAAAEKLAASEKPEAIEALAEAANDPEASVRQAITVALGRFKDERVVIPLTGLLNDMAPEVRAAAATALGDIDAKCAEKPLISSLKDQNDKVRQAAAKALDKLGWQPQSSEERAVHSIAIGRYMQAAQEGETAFFPLVSVLKGDTYHQRKAAIEALSRLDDSRSLRPLISALKDSDSHVRVSAIEAIGRQASPEAIDALIVALKDEFPPARTAAAEALGRSGGAKALVPLTVALRDKSWDVRRAAVEALGRLGDARALEPLVALFKDKDPDVRMATVRALSTLKDPRAIPALIVTLTDDQRQVREAALDALQRLDPQWDRSDAAQQVIPELENAHRSREYWVRQAASDVLARIAQARSDSQALEGEPNTVLVEAPVVVQLLAGLLRDGDRDFRLAAAEALGRLGDHRTSKVLEEAREDIDPWVKHAAERAYEEMQERGRARAER